MKIKFLLFSLSLCVLVALSACTKTSGPSSVSGQAIDQTTGKGVPYATVALLSQNSNAVGAGGIQQLQTVSSDANGNFSFNFNYASGNTYTVAAQAPYYYNDGNASTTLSAGKNNNVKINMVPKGFIRFNLINVPPLDTIAAISVGDLNNTTNFSRLYKDTFFIAYGYGNTVTHFSYTIVDNHRIYHEYFDNIYLKALDTVSYTINY